MYEAVYVKGTILIKTMNANTTVNDKLRSAFLENVSIMKKNGQKGTILCDSETYFEIVTKSPLYYADTGEIVIGEYYFDVLFDENVNGLEVQFD